MRLGQEVLCSARHSPQVTSRQVWLLLVDRAFPNYGSEAEMQAEYVFTRLKPCSGHRSERH